METFPNQLVVIRISLLESWEKSYRDVDMRMLDRPPPRWSREVTCYSEKQIKSKCPRMSHLAGPLSLYRSCHLLTLSPHPPVGKWAETEKWFSHPLWSYKIWTRWFWITVVNKGSESWDIPRTHWFLYLAFLHIDTHSVSSGNPQTPPILSSEKSHLFYVPTLCKEHMALQAIRRQSRTWKGSEVIEPDELWNLPAPWALSSHMRCTSSDHLLERNTGPCS